MARFSLSPPVSSSVRRRRQQQQQQQRPSTSSSSSTAAAPQWKWTFPPQDRYYRSQTSTSSSTTSSSSSEEEEEEEEDGEEEEDDEDVEEEEPPHPLGFESSSSSSSYGRTRFGLSPGASRRGGHVPPSAEEDDRAWDALIRIDDNRRPSSSVALPVRSYNLDLRGTRVPSGALLLHAAATTSSRLRRRGGRAGVEGEGKEDDDDDDDDADVEGMRSGMDRIAGLVAAARLVRDEDEDDYDVLRISPPRSTSRLLQLASACEDMHSGVSREMRDLERESTSRYRESCRGLLLLLRAEDELAASARTRIDERRRLVEEEGEKLRLERDAREGAMRATREEEGRVAAERAAIEEARAEGGRRREARRLEAMAGAARAVEEEAARADGHVDRAIELATRVDDMRSGLRAFDESSAAGRRRLQFKKVVNGRVNTLSHDSGKVRNVADAVIDAIARAARDDDDYESTRTTTAGGSDPALALGRRYLLDLLCSNLIVRAQADGFNGTRGDGFPLAATFASVSVRCAEICPLLEGHLYRVCPTAVPALSLVRGDRGGGNGNNNNDGEYLMESLGMIRDKNGEFESFDKFLHRTEGLISVMANIMSSLPSNHTLLGGHAGAITWLRRFMDLLPPAPTSPLPLITAPVLVAFLTGAGHMLANRYPEEFASLLDNVKKSVDRRLDVSPVGVPSATRLRKVLDDVGFEGLRKDLPNGAVADLYDDGKGERSDADAGAGSGMSSSTAFGKTHMHPSSAFGETTFGGSAGGGADATNNPFSPSEWGGSTTEFSSTASTATVSNTSSSLGTLSSPFASDVGSGVGGSGFGPSTAAAPSPSPFGGGQSSWFGTTVAASTPAPGLAPATMPSSFGGFDQSSGFGMVAAAPAPSAGFAPATMPSPFGGVGQSSGFGMVAAAAAPSTGFASATAPSPFGVAPSPFGGGGGQSPGFGFASAATSSSFGVSTAPAPSPFSAAPAPAAAGFGSSTFASTAGQQTSPFGAGGFGGNPSSFPAPSPFGNNSSWQGIGNNTAGQGDKKQLCKFFASGSCNKGDRCNFSHEINSVGQGQSSGGSKPGGGNGKAPCKFFASGQCRSGSACRFSHEQTGGGGAPSFGSGTAFGGGGFGQASNPSPFSGGGSSGGGVFGTSQFGTAGVSNTSRSSNPFGGPRR
ncbi:hypothetical protein ACHAW5_005793 [Stephanodiscus triporus]|uniref:mRNA export factor GLE1 n=1 Tax=Stephanodiscus triporus TaxID=2934178 RepID=A0ABD3PUT1_9STRA